MDNNHVSFVGDGGFAYDHSLELITEDFDYNYNRRSMSSQNTLASSEALRPQERKPPRPQRPKSLTSEQTKHRRTRSGCYTCRQRRVKCDEAHPICDRCRKGKRDCTYPDKTTSTKANRPAPKSKSPSACSYPSSDEHDDLQQPALTPDELDSITSASARASRTDSKRSTMLEEYSGAIAEMKSQLDSSAKTHTGLVLEHTPDWSSYPQDIRFYLEWFRDNITYAHYAFKHDCRDFLKTTYLEAAINFKPLLYSLVAFSAYHYALRHPDSRPEKFLDYYDQSVSLFRTSLAKGNSSAVPVLLTMLQLATIEEFLGDWLNLLSHQRAATKLMQETFTPESMTQTFTHRVILVWYWRHDLLAGVLSGQPLTLPREWFAVCVDSCAAAAARNTVGNLGVWFDHFFTTSRLLVTDAALLFSVRVAGRAETEEFRDSVVELWARMQTHAQRVESAFRDVPYFNDTWTKAENSLTDYMDPQFMFTGPYWTMNYILVDSWIGRTVFMHALQGLRTEGLYKHAEPKIESGLILKLALKQCKMLEAMEHSREGPAGAVLGLQASLGIVALFLPIEPKYTTWTRQKLALMEANGYIYPPGYRKGLAGLWHLDVEYWWLPNGQGMTPLLKSMRQFIDFRAKSAQRPTDDRGIDLRDLNGMFRSLRLVETLRQDTTMVGP